MPLKSKVDVSIIIPMYNMENYITDTLDSILFQDTKYELEVIIIDDSSTDSSFNVCKNYIMSKQCSNFSLISNSHKKGVSGARNTGLELAEGNWISFLDSDDILLPNSIEKKLRLAYKNDVKLVSCGYYDWYPLDNRKIPIKETDNNLKKILTKKNSESFILQDAYNKILETLSYVNVGTILVSSSIANNVRFDESLKMAEDTDFILTVALKSQKMLYIDDNLMSYRRDRNTSITTQGEPGSIYREYVLKKFLKDPRLLHNRQITKRALFDSLMKNIYFFRENKNYIKATQKSLSLIWNFPLSTKAWLMLVASVIRY
ncbi:glycosyltransferase family A protein [Vibrio sp. TH_r3]|uniref:glycosyltransferase family 2 protein n=1 Tax=Vibrio sp. TH_r3 TaxID=3082084 RepID=UPI0029548745|nr:glycosyltransferase family A protein [Vibrio sp. TH_r3]MDV7103468.1 glycosyltransferase family A protein [Vibrio sp. TH_r3]